MMHLGQLKIVDRKTTSTSTTSDVVQTGIYSYRQSMDYCNKQTNGKTDRKTNKQTKRKADKQTDKQ